MTALELIARLREKGIRIAVNDGELELDAPKGALDSELRAELIRRKPELLRLLAWSRRSGRDLPLAAVDRSQVLPLSWAQQRLWFLDQLEPNSSAYNISWTVRLNGKLDQAALRSAFTQLSQRHETLRTSFPAKGGEPTQQINAALSVALSTENQLGVSNEQLRARLGRLAAQPFDLASGPLWRVSLLQLHEQEHILLVVIHHIVADGASMRVLFRELAALYDGELSGKAVELPELPVQYADFSVWQREWLDTQELERQSEYWLQQLHGLPPLLELPWDRPRSAAMRYRGASVLHVIPPDLAEELRALGRARGSTLFMVMLTAFYVLLMKYSSRKDLVVGTPMGGRPRSDLEGLIGFFINTVVLRADLEGNPSFEALLHQVRDVALAAHSNQELPFEKLVEVLQPERELSYSPVFQVMFDLQEEPRWRLPVKNLEVIPEVVFSSRTSSFDLTLSIRQAENGLDAMFEYDTDLFDEASIERLSRHYHSLLQQIVSSPQLPVASYSLLDSEQQRELITRWTSAQAEFPQDATLVDLFAAQAALHPDVVALQSTAGSCSYSELNRRANRLAHRLQGAGVEPGQPVAVAAERSVETFVAIVAVLKAGGIVLPLDPDYPSERLSFMLTDSGAAQLLLTPTVVEKLDLDCSAVEIFVLDETLLDTPDYPDSEPVSLLLPAHMAFLMYTSGTTGQPKGVGLTHQGLVNYLHQLSTKTSIRPGDRILQFASLSFDIAIEESFSALLNGATLVLRDAHAHLSVTDFFTNCDREQITWLSLPTAWWHELCAALDTEQVPVSLRSVVIGGEKAHREALLQWQQHAPGLTLINTYGPTETSIVATWCELTHLDMSSAGELPIGQPVPNVQAWVLDEQLRPLPAGVPGELYIGGVGVAPGYWRRPELSAEWFVADPFSAVPDALLYRTGDRARYQSDGRLLFLGREDQQVKIRGHRVEPAEVEAVLAGLPGVSGCVVIAALAGEHADAQLVGYFVGAADSAELLQLLQASLPDYMQPAALLQLEALPLTVNGKLNRHALPQPEWQRNPEQVFVAPRNEQERVIAAIWSEVLGVPQIGVHDDFFALGGHSLLATRVVSRIRDAFGSALPLRNLFAAPTVAGLCQALDLLVDRHDELPLLARSRGSQILPLSWTQQRLWLLDQLEVNGAAYNLPWATRLTGKLDCAALQAAIDALLERHEILRTSFAEHAGEPVQVVTAQLHVPLQVEDVAANKLTDRLTELAMHPFSLSESQLIRFHLLRNETEEQVLLIVLHHIVADGWSMGVLFRELSHYYNGFSGQANGGAVESLPELPVQYADYALWQRDWLGLETQQEQEQYWLKQMAGAPQLLELPLDQPRPLQPSGRGAWESIMLDADALAALQQLAAASGVTLFMLTLAVFKALLAIHTGREDIVVGTPIAGRRHTATENLIGCFLNTLALRTSLDANPSFSELLERIKTTTLTAFDNQDMPFEKLLELLQPERSARYTPLVQVLFNLHNAPASRADFNGLSAATVQFERHVAKFDLAAVLSEQHDGLQIGFEYSTDLFNAQTMQTLLRQYRHMLLRVTADPNLRLAELVRLVKPQFPSFLHAALPASDTGMSASVFESFAVTVGKFPRRPAVDDGRVSWSYAELASRANIVAAELLAAGVEPGNHVGVLLGHDAPMVAGLLGVLQAGCAYVPLDRNAPVARLHSIIADAQLQAVVVGSDCAELWAELNSKLPAVSATTQPVVAGLQITCPASPDDLAYVLYTSGTTGVPKGVMQTQRNVLHHALTYSHALQINQYDHLSLLSHYGFDAAVMDIFAALLSGACLHPIDILTAGSPQQLIKQLDQAGTTVLHATPTVFRYVVSESDVHQSKTDHFINVRAVVLGGEETTAKDFALFREHFSADAIFVNGMGPSESTTALQFFADAHTELSAGVVPVGLPVAKTSVQVRDVQNRESAICGELCISSPYVSTGYWGLPELTAEKFRPVAESNESWLYRTGDRVRYLPDGQLVFTGRIDNQLKIRGYRIEPAEIEATLLTLPGVQRAAVIAVKRPNDEQAVLVAYILGTAAEDTLITKISALLPTYMQPARYLFVSDWPLLANGKLNRRALPQPDWSNAVADAIAEPINATERVLLDIWRTVLSQDNFGCKDDFFRLGGHSLMATRVIARIRDQLGAELGLRELFAEPTIRGLASRIDAVQSVTQGPTLKPHSAGVLPPLSWAQQRLWFLDQLEPDSAAYNLHWAAKLNGPLNDQALQEAVNTLVARHESLRTSFGGEDGSPVQLIASQLSVNVQNESLPGASDAAVQRRLLNLIRQPFDLQRGPLLRVHILRLADQEVVLLLMMHHIVSDGWSMGVLFRELATVYQARCENYVAKLPALPVQYADYSVWQRAWLSGGELERQESYWRKQLTGAPPLLELPLDHVRPMVQRYRGVWVSETFTLELQEQLRKLATEQGATLFMVLLAAFKVVIARHTGCEDVVIGTPIAGRRRTELEGLIGFFLNTLVLRTDLSGNPAFTEILGRVRQGTLGAYDHQELPFEKLLEILQPARSTAYTPVVQVTFNLHNEPGGWPDLTNLQVQPFAVDRGTAKFDLAVAVVESGQGLQVGFEYNTDLFERETIVELMHHYGAVLSAVVLEPQLLLAAIEMPSLQTELPLEPLLSAATFPVEAKDQTLLARFADIVDSYPDSLAVDDFVTRWTYRELDIMANAVSHAVATSAAPCTLVGLLLGHDAMMLAGLIGVLKAGCVYVPLDPEAPAARIAAIVAEAGLSLVVTDAARREALPTELSNKLTVVDVTNTAITKANSVSLGLHVQPDDLAYVLFTSGSTGTPKGVMQTHRNALHHARAYINALQIKAQDRLSLFSTYGFDASVMDIFGALLSGACICPADLRAYAHPGELLDRIGLDETAEDEQNAEGITVLHTTPTVFRFLMRHKVCRHELTRVRAVVLGGEETRHADFELFKRHFAPPTVFVNGLGPSESTMAAQFFANHKTRMPGRVVPVGKAVADTKLVLLNEEGMPAGISGELAICSAFVSKGYLQQPELTKKSFIPRPDGTVLYRTGDRARRLPDGNLVYEGRLDAQVKVRGHRIEPGEIEVKLLAIAEVERATVMLRDDSADGRQADARLVAYVVPVLKAELDAVILRQQLKKVLPEYMVPQAFVSVGNIPLLPNGKVDRHALPAPDWSALAGADRVAPRTATERQLADIWEEILGVSNVGVHDDFFELGGHSLLAAQLAARVTESMQVGLPLRRLFDTPTIAGLAEHVDALQWALQGKPGEKFSPTSDPTK